MGELSLIIGGDIVPSFKNIEYFVNGNVNKIADDECRVILDTADFRIFNLETPLTEQDTPISKEGANFAVPEKCINGLKALNTSVVTLANNHCKDQGEEALLKTVEILSVNGIKSVGYGNKRESSLEYIYLEKNNIKIAVVACAETEFTIYDKKEYGAIPYDDFYTNKTINEVKNKCDAVIVLYHGGKEYYKYPAPYMQERCRRMVDSGADVVLCQHTHCIGCYEKYSGKTIIYGQGNFIFHQKNNREETKEGLLVKFDVSTETKTVSYIPVILDENDTVCVAKKEVSKQIIEGFEERSRQIQEINAVDELYSQYADKKIEDYFFRMKKRNLFDKLVNKIGISSKSNMYTKPEILKLLNMVQNESHRELFIQGLKNIIDKR